MFQINLPFIRELKQGGGQILAQAASWRLWRPPTLTRGYANAQLDDYNAGFRHQSPLRLRIRVAFSHPADQLQGTAGFGFWNAPFAPGSRRWRFPKAAWFFFGSPPLDLPLALDVPGSGFKAATIDATHWPFFVLLPTAPLGFLLMRQRFFYRHLWKIAQRAIKVSEQPITAKMEEPYTYQLDWRKEAVIFSIDDQIIHRSPHSPSGKMGLVIWIDNQYAIVTPQGRFGWGLLESPQAQWLDLFELTLTPLG